MADNNVTLKDISKATGYSLISIHRAIYNKDGLSEDTRKKILDAVKDMGYEVNYMASALKRKPISVGVVLMMAHVSGDYHDTMLQGARIARQEVQGLNCSCKEYLFTNDHGSAANEIEILEKIYKEGKCDGLVILPSNTSLELRLSIEKLIAKGIPVVLIDDQFDAMQYLCCISPHSYLIGRLGAEYTCRISRPGKILVVLGDETSKTHQENYMGFCSYIQEKGQPFSCIPVSDPYNEETLERNLEFLLGEDVVALYTVREKNSRAIAEIAKRHPELKLQVLASDLCPSNVAYLKEGVFAGIIDKNSFQRGYLGLHTLFEYVLKNEMPKGHILSVPVAIVMQSNLPLYVGEKGPGICITSSDDVRLTGGS